MKASLPREEGRVVLVFRRYLNGRMFYAKSCAQALGQSVDIQIHSNHRR